MYKALITDIDGTAIPISTGGETVTGSLRETVRFAISQGAKLTCATGREWRQAEPVVRALGIRSPCIVEGGTRIVHAESGETIWQKCLDDTATDFICKMIKRDAPNAAFMGSWKHGLQSPGTLSNIPPQTRYIYLVAIDEDLARNLIQNLHENANAVAHITPAWAGNGLVDVHITHPEATKRHAIHVWQEIEGVTPAECIGMGDSGNDIPIFEATGLKIAVGNATSQLKDLADFVAPSVEDNALESVIRRFLPH